jgi:hypothetical protein
MFRGTYIMTFATVVSSSFNQGHPLSNVCGKGTGALGSCEYVVSFSS